MSSTSTNLHPQPLQVYKLIRTLGEGAFGKVKLVKHLPSEKFVAMKEISKASLTTTPTNYDRFIREITFFKTLSHPHVIALYEVIESPTHYYFVMNYADNSDLLTYITEQRYLKESKAKEIFTQIITGVMYLHKQHVVHRDLKPENILLMNNYNTAIISDFGLANWYNNDNKLFTMCGSLHYASPEMIMGETYNGEASDVWSLGVMLYVMITGKLPFDGCNNDEVCNKIVNVVYKFPMDVKVSKECKDLIMKMLVHEPQERIKLSDVMVHPFVNGCKDGKSVVSGCDEDKVMVDTVCALGKFGIETTKEEIKKKIKDNVFDQVTTCYKLIKEKYSKHIHNSESGITCVSYRPKVKCKLLSPRTDINNNNNTVQNGLLKGRERNKCNNSHTHVNSKRNVSSKTSLQSKTNIRHMNNNNNSKHKDKHSISKNNNKLTTTTSHHHSTDKQHHPFYTTINLTTDTSQIQTIFKHKRIAKKTKTTLQKTKLTPFTSSYADMNINTTGNTNTILHLYTSNNPNKQKLSLKQQQSTSNTFNSHDIRSTSNKKATNSSSLNKTKLQHTPRKCLFTFNNNMKPLSTSKPTPHKQQHVAPTTNTTNIYMICTTHQPINIIKRKLESIATKKQYTIKQSKYNVYQLINNSNTAVLDIHVNTSGILKLCHCKGEKSQTKEMVQVILHEIGFD